MKEVKKLLVVLVAAVFFFGLFVLCDKYSENVKADYASQINPSIVNQGSSGTDSKGQTVDAGQLSVEKMVQNMVTKDYSASVTLAAAGDILCQQSVLEKAYNSDSEKFDFSDDFQYVKDLFLTSDYAVATLKTTLAGKYNGSSDEYYGYTTEDSNYNSPEVLADNLKSAGISLVNIATNHALDSDAAGLVSTIGYLDQAGLVHVGAAATADGSTDYTQNVGGVNIGFIGYTNSSNGYSLDSDAECVLNTLNDYDAQSIETLCNRVSAMKDETGQSTRSCLVLYGMGALLSGETYASSEKDTDISAVFDFNIARNDFGETAIQSFTVTPVYLNWYNDAIQPIPVCEAKDTDKYAEMLDDNAMDRINSAYEGTITHLLDGSGLTSTYENYAYHVSLQ
ncbi:MAG: CapA family protein [Coprococcus sp.]